MRITRIGLYKLKIPLKEPFITSLGVDTDALNVVVKIETDSGDPHLASVNSLINCGAPPNLSIHHST